jgi:hypothetical protein
MRAQASLGGGCYRLFETVEVVGRDLHLCLLLWVALCVERARSMRPRP